MSEAVSGNWQAMVQSFFCVRELPWGGMPIDQQWSLASCFHKIERVHRATYISVEMQAVSLFLLAVFKISVIIYVSNDSGRDINFSQSDVYEDVAHLDVKMRSSNQIPCIVRLLSVQDTSNYIIPLIPKSFSLCNFIPLSQLASFMLPPDLIQDSPTVMMSTLGEGKPSCAPLPLANKSFVPSSPSVVKSDDAVCSEVLPSSLCEDLMSLVPQTLVMEELDDSCYLVPPPDADLVPVISLTLEIADEVMVDAIPQAGGANLVLAGWRSLQCPPELEISPISDDWEIITVYRVDELVTCIELYSSRLVFPEYILLRDSVEIPYDVPRPPRRGRVPTSEEQDCWELVTLYPICPGMVIIKVELEVIFSEYVMLFN